MPGLASVTYRRPACFALSTGSATISFAGSSAHSGDTFDERVALVGGRVREAAASIAWVNFMGHWMPSNGSAQDAPGSAAPGKFVQ